MLVFCASLGACSQESSSLPSRESSELAKDEAFGQKRSGIFEGVRSESDAAVFLVEVGERGLCSAVLIAPRLLLTAGHCLSGQFGLVDCGETPLKEALPAGEFRVTNAPDLQAAPNGVQFRKVASAWVLGAGNDLCGNDLGVIQLAEEAHGVRPLIVGKESEKRLSPYRAVGYGAGHVSGTGERVRRTSGALSAICEESQECDGVEIAGLAGELNRPAPEMVAGEWLGAASTCPGDSGGPALVFKDRAPEDAEDAEDVVVGILSRGTEDCAFSLYTRPNIEPLRALVRHLSESSDTAVPTWAIEQEKTPREPPLEPQPDPQPEASAGASGSSGQGGSPEPPSKPEASSKNESSGCSCSMSGAAPDHPSGWLLLSVFSLTLFGRRRTLRIQS